MLFIPRANYFQFNPGQKIVQERVESRMILLTIEGDGLYKINGLTYQQEPGNLYLLPWNHRLEYHSSGKEALRIACIHIIPDFTEDPPVYDISHNSKSSLYRSSSRKDIQGLLPERTVLPKVFQESPITNLIHYIIRKFAAGHLTHQSNSNLARILVEELKEHANTRQSEYVPYILQRLIRKLHTSLKMHLSVDTLCEWGNCSRATVFRLFREYYDTTPNSYIKTIQIKKAEDLLSTSTLTIKEIAVKCGFSDQQYFSKCFKAGTGLSPTVYRRQNAVIY